uniref:Cnidarian restricted protein n=1 Tax=Clytia hemisphaerica TaxID=252671 RepID=A0A7M5WR41_9CNID
MSSTPGFLLCFLCCCVVVSVPMALGDLILPCTEVRNVTIIPYVMLWEARRSRNINLEKYFHDSVIQLSYLVKSFVDKPCSIVWILSPIQSRSIRLTMENYAEFLEREFQAITQTDENEVIKVLLNIPHNNNDIKQTLFVVTFSLKVSFDYKHDKVFELVRKPFVRKQVDLVVWSIGLFPYRFFQKWLPNQNTIYMIQY